MPAIATSSKRITAPVLVAGALSIVLIAVALLRLAQAHAGIDIERARIGPTPVTVFRAADAPRGPAMPVVVIAHGFAGSQKLMQPFGATLAKNGYLAVTFDYYGHGRNLRPLGGGITEVEGAHTDAARTDR